MLKSQINPTEIKVGKGPIKTLRDGRVLIETGSIQEAETLTNSIRGSSNRTPLWNLDSYSPGPKFKKGGCKKAPPKKWGAKAPGNV